MQAALYRRVSELLDRSRAGHHVARSVWVKRLFEALDWGDRAAFSVEKDTENSFNLSVEACPIVSVVSEPPTAIGPVFAALNRAYNRDIPWVVATDFHSLGLFGAYWMSFPHDVTSALAWKLDAPEFLLEAPKLNLLTPHEVARNELDQLYDAFPLRERRLPIDVHLVERMSQWRDMAFQALGPMQQDVDPLVHRLINSLFLVRYLEDSNLIRERLLSSVGTSRTEILRVLSRTFSEVRKSTNYPTLQQGELARLEPSPLRLLISQLYGFEEWGVQYDFSAMTVDILGRFYEEYLRLKPKTKTVVARKTEAHFLFEGPTHEFQDVRREKGIFYTPRFIVRYIVSNLIRRYEASSPQSPPSVIDLACGSGTFLVTALEELSRRRHWRQSAAQSIIGLDSDDRAVEAARLNLVAKCISDNLGVPVPQLNLIKYDLLEMGIDGQPLQEILPSGAVDIVVGNPPYISYETLSKEYDVQLLRKHFNLGTKRIDSYILFVEAALRILREGGFCGLVLPTAFLRSSSAGHLRDWISQHADLLEIVDFQDQPVFQNVGVYVCVVLLRKRQPDKSSPKVTIGKIYNLSATPSAQLGKLSVVQETGDDTQEVFRVEQPRGSKAWVFRNQSERAILDKILSSSTLFGDAALEIWQGVKTGADDIFVLELDGKPGVESPDEDRYHRVEPEATIPFLRNRDLRRWCTRPRALVIYPYDLKTGVPLPWSRLQKDFPKCAAYLQSRRVALAGRKSLNREAWYELIRPRVASVFSPAPKLFIAELSLRPMVTTCDMEHAAIAGSTGGGSVILLKDKTYDADSLMAFLNSSVAEWSMRQVAPVRRGGWMLLEQSVLKTVPIPNFLTQKKSFARSELSRLASIARARMRESTGYQSQESRQQLSAVEDQIDSLIIGALGLDARDGTYIRRRVLALRGSKGDKIQEPGLL